MPYALRYYFGPVRLNQSEDHYRKCFDDTEWSYIQSQQCFENRQERLFGRLWIKSNLRDLGVIASYGEISLGQKLEASGVQSKARFAISHSRGMCFCVLIAGGDACDLPMRLGCDVERRSRLCIALHRIINEEDTLRCPHIWCVKEACYKAMPSGECSNIKDIVVCGNDLARYRNYRFHYAVRSTNGFVICVAAS